MFGASLFEHITLRTASPRYTLLDVLGEFQLEIWDAVVVAVHDIGLQGGGIFAAVFPEAVLVPIPLDDARLQGLFQRREVGLDAVVPLPLVLELHA